MIEAPVQEHKVMAITPPVREPGTDSLTGLKDTHLERQTLTGPHVQLKSEVFTISRAVNPLVAAAGPLLTLATQLNNLEHAPDLARLHTQLSHEVRVFESKAQALGYRAQVVLAARYLLCCLLDESLRFSPWNETEDWHEQNMLVTFQGERNGGERSIYILERSAEDAGVYLDLVELGYLCLSLGMQGKFRFTEGGHNFLNIFIENLYQIIQHHRGQTSKQLAIAPPENNLSNKKELNWRLPPIWVTSCITGVLLLGIYIPYHRHLETIAAPVDSALATLQHEAADTRNHQ